MPIFKKFMKNAKTFLFTFFWLEGPKKSYKRLKFGCKKQKIQLFKIPYLQKIGAHFEERTVGRIDLFMASGDLLTAQNG